MNDCDAVTNPAAGHGQPGDLTEAREWVSEPELRRLLDLSAATVRRLRARGLPHIGRNRLRRYHYATVLKWLAEHA